MADYAQQTVSDCGKTLRDMLGRFGPDLASDEKRFKGVALDFIRDLPLVNLLILALSADVPQELQAPVGSTPKPLVIGRIIGRLQRDHNLNESAARLAVLAWAQALGILAPGEAAAFFRERSEDATVPEVLQQSVNKTEARTLSVSATKIEATFKNGVLTVNDMRYELALIPDGEFQMGSDSSAAFSDEKPVHTVHIAKSFWLGKTEVPQGLWQAVTGSNPSYFKKGDDYPVEHVSWDDCQAFITKLNQMLGSNYFRLPTEGEWEYACRAGTTGDRYGDIDAIAWYGSNSGSTTHPVGQKQANAWGLYDTLGNVYEYCQDWYGSYSSGYQTDPIGPGAGSLHVIRGGSWLLGAKDVRAAFRIGLSPGGRNGFIGFRLARTN